MPRTRTKPTNLDETNGSELDENEVLVTLAHKRPLKAIPDDSPVLPPRPKRRPKQVLGSLGERLRQKKPSSSLPPSSPLPASSTISFSPPTKPRNFLDEDDAICVEESAFEHVPEDRDILAEDPDLSRSDPFGFFGVEKKLRTQRIHRIVAHPFMRTDSPEPSVPRTIPPRPHKKGIGMRGTLSSTSKSNFAGPSSSRASTPSPSGSQPQADVTSISDSPGNTSAEVDNDVDTPGKNSQPRKRKSTATKQVDTTQKKSRSTRQAAKKEQVGAALMKKKRTGRPKIKKEADSEQEDEQWERDRIARIEYFKELDDYSLEKENVYVI